MHYALTLPDVSCLVVVVRRSTAEMSPSYSQGFATLYLSGDKYQAVIC